MVGGPQTNSTFGGRPADTPAKSIKQQTRPTNAYTFNSYSSDALETKLDSPNES